jgi:hypothetical protein
MKFSLIFFLNLNKKYNRSSSKRYRGDKFFGSQPYFAAHRSLRRTLVLANREGAMLNGE